MIKVRFTAKAVRLLLDITPPKYVNSKSSEHKIKRNITIPAILNSLFSSSFTNKRHTKKPRIGIKI
jgi:hypothetical protein